MLRHSFILFCQQSITAGSSKYPPIEEEGKKRSEAGRNKNKNKNLPFGTGSVCRYCLVTCENFIKIGNHVDAFVNVVFVVAVVVYSKWFRIRLP